MTFTTGWITIPIHYDVRAHIFGLFETTLRT